MIARVVNRVADAFGTKAAIVIALAWSLLPVAFPAYQVFILYVSAGVVQLVALPLLSYQARTATKVAEQNSADLAEHKDVVHASLAALHEHLGTGHVQ